MRKIKTEEVVRLSKIFDIHPNVLLSEEEPAKIKIIKKEKEKFKQLMLYILTKV